MNALLFKPRYALLAVFAAVTVLFIGSPSYAQRDAAAKARGEFGTGFWTPRSGARSYTPPLVETRRSFSYQPLETRRSFSYQPLETQRSYSYEPAPFDVGDEVVAVRPTRLMKGTRKLAGVQGGQEFRVLDVEGPWLGAEIEVAGETIQGWVWHRHVTSIAEAAAPAAPGEPAASPAQSPVERRSFSYEPLQPVPPRFSHPPDQGSGRRMRDPVERRLRPGRGLWE